MRKPLGATLPLTLALLALAAAGTPVLVVGCRSAPTTPHPTSELTGNIRVSGAWALYPMMVKWAEEFRRIHPKVRIDVSAGGAGKGAADALGGLVDIGMVSRDIHPNEITKGGFGVAVVRDAVLPVASAANPVASDLATRGVKRETFTVLFVQGKRLTWGDVVGEPGIKDKVNVYTRSDACGAAETWAKYLGASQEDLQGVGVYGDPGLAETVKKDPLGIGYNNLNYAYDPKTNKPVQGLWVVPIDINANGTLDPSENVYASRTEVKRAIANGIYPSPPARDLNLLTKGKPSGLTRDFITWILTDGQKFVDEAGYIELPAAALARSSGALK